MISSDIETASQSDITETGSDDNDQIDSDDDDQPDSDDDDQPASDYQTPSAEGAPTGHSLDSEPHSESESDFDLDPPSPIRSTYGQLSLQAALPLSPQAALPPLEHFTSIVTNNAFVDEVGSCVQELRKGPLSGDIHRILEELPLSDLLRLTPVFTPTSVPLAFEADMASIEAIRQLPTWGQLSTSRRLGNFMGYAILAEKEGEKPELCIGPGEMQTRAKW